MYYELLFLINLTKDYDFIFQAPIQSENDNYKNQKMGLARQLSTHQTTIQLRTKEKFEIIGENKAQQEIAVALNDKVKELDDILSKLIEKQKSINVEIDTVRKARETSIVANQQLSDKLKLIDIELNQLKVPKTISKGLGAKDSCTARSVFDNNLDKVSFSHISFLVKSKPFYFKIYLRYGLYIERFIW